MDAVSHFRRSRRGLLHRGGIAGALAASLLSFSSGMWAQSLGPCDLGAHRSSYGDVPLAIAAALAAGPTGSPCSLGIEGPNTCTEVTVLRVYNWDNGQLCITYNTHAANLTWTASATPNATYNVYRATSSGGPWTQVQSSVSGTAFADNATTDPGAPPLAGQTYYYVVTAVANGVESAQSSPPVQATIPSP